MRRKWQPSFKACDSVLPFQILYDQGVITGFVWQVILIEQEFGHFPLNNQLTPAQSMICTCTFRNKNWGVFVTPCNSACFLFVGKTWKGWIGVKLFWSTITSCLAHLHFFQTLTLSLLQNIYLKPKRSDKIFENICTLCLNSKEFYEFQKDWIFWEYFPQHIATLPGDKWEHPDAMAVAAIVDRLHLQFEIMQ